MQNLYPIIFHHFPSENPSFSSTNSRFMINSHCTNVGQYKHVDPFLLFNHLLANTVYLYHLMFSKVHVWKNNVILCEFYSKKRNFFYVATFRIRLQSYLKEFSLKPRRIPSPFIHPSFLHNWNKNDTFLQKLRY